MPDTKPKSASKKKKPQKKSGNSRAAPKKQAANKRGSKAAKVNKNPIKKKAPANKTRPVQKSAHTLIAGVPDEQKRQDCETLLTLMQKISGKPPVVWGGSMIGFGQYHYKYESGREGDFFITGFAPRAQNLAVYIMTGFEHEKELMHRLGKYKTGKSCLYIKRLADVDQKQLAELIRRSVKIMRERYDCT